MCSNPKAFVELVDSAIDMDSLRGLVDDPDSGAHGWFVGVTRRTTKDRVTDTLFYEAHPKMARLELVKLAERAAEKFSLLHVVIVHRLGEVPIAEASVVVGCSSPHRVDTFAAMAWIMDSLKQEVPIWKRELYSDGTTEWVHPGLDPKAAENPPTEVEQ
ncbi:MAG: molybdenum cofactor biosynthesis protein MoaE [Rubripirellula sp.]